MKYSLEQIINLAKDVELGDSIDWDNVALDRDKIYQIISSQVYDEYGKTSDDDEREAILLATVIKLVVENFVLNVKLDSY